MRTGPMFTQLTKQRKYRLWKKRRKRGANNFFLNKMIANGRNKRSNFQSGGQFHPRETQIVAVDGLAEDYEFCAVDVEKLTDIFKDSVLLFRNKQVFIYLRLLPSFRDSFSESLFHRSKPFTLLPEFLRENKMFLIVSDFDGNSQILPTDKNDELFTYLKETGQQRFGVSMATLYENKSKLRNKSKHKRKEKLVSLTIQKRISEKVILAEQEQYITLSFPLDEDHDSLKYPIQVSEDQLQSMEPVASSNPYLRLTGPPARYPDYMTDNQRLNSFKNFWPHTKPDPEQLTDAGFFYTEHVDLVRCFQCGIGLKDFSPADNPLLEHVRYSGECPHLSRRFGEGRIASLKAHLQATDPEYNRQTQFSDLCHHSSAVATTRYRKPQYQTLEARLATYVGWPPGAGQTPRQLAGAGLYYTGVEDHVRCFACDGGLRRWDPDDDPWTEHCRWFPSCPYCIEQKGEEFIALVQASTDEDLGAAGGETLVETIKRLTIRSPEVQSVYDECKGHYRDMGFQEDYVKEAILELLDRGTQNPSIDNVVDQIGVIQDRKEAEARMSQQTIQSDSPYEQNLRLKRMVYCTKCHRNTVSALFLPCTHIKFCMECAESLSTCPLCHRVIIEKIKTFIV